MFAGLSGPLKQLLLHCAALSLLCCAGCWHDAGEQQRLTYMLYSRTCVCAKHTAISTESSRGGNNGHTCCRRSSVSSKAQLLWGLLATQHPCTASWGLTGSCSNYDSSSSSSSGPVLCSQRLPLCSQCLSVSQTDNAAPRSSSTCIVTKTCCLAAFAAGPT